MADIALYELPENWIWTTLGEISTNPQYGYTTSASNEARGPKFLRITDLSSGSVNWDDVPYCAEPPDDIDKYLLFEGDIVIARSGSVGKAYLVKNPPEAVFASYLIRFRPILVFDRFVDAFLQTGFYFDQIADSSSGNTIFNVNAQKMRMLNIPVAPLSEQHRIIDEIEAQFSRLDTWLEVMQKLREQLPRLRASILKAAVEGRLVGQDPDDEPADVLLQRILDERRRKWEDDYLADLEAKGKPTPKDDKWKKKYEEPEAPDMDGLHELPDGWAWVAFEQIGEVRLGRQRSPSKRSKDYPTKYIRAANITEHGLDLSDVLEMEFTPEEREIYRLKKNDIVISEASGSPDQVGKSAIWNDEIEGCCFQNTVIRLRAPQLDSRYLLIILKHFYQSGVLTRTASGVGINHLSANRFARLAFPLAPERQQYAIIDEVNLKLSVIDRLEETIRINVKRAARMRQSVLKKAFEGRLAEQDPDDEPASELLERIREERQRRTEEEKQRPKQQREHKVSTTKTGTKPLYDTLKEAGKPLSAHDLFQQAGFTHATIDDFYEELRAAVHELQTIRTRHNRNNEVFLEVTG